MTEEITAAEYDAASEGLAYDNFYQFAKLMIEDVKMPFKAKDDFWGYLGKDTILTRIEKSDKWIFENNFVIQRNFDIMSKPAFVINIEELKKYENIRNRYTAQLHRGLQGFERQALMTQIREMRTSKPTPENTSGMLAGLKRKLGLGKKKESTDYGSG